MIWEYLVLGLSLSLSSFSFVSNFGLASGNKNYKNRYIIIKITMKYETSAWNHIS